MEHFVTLFDSAFLPQGLALHDSLQRHAGESMLWVVCMDAEAKQRLDGMGLPGLRTIAVSDIEQAFPELLAVKSGRTRAEYCWTLTPFTPWAVFDRDAAAQRVTYVDADMYFLQSPQKLLVEFELSGKAVQITDHGYAPEYDQSATSGRFCVQFMTFVRGRGEEVRQWWQDRCVEWCFNRLEDGKFGDQKYLDDWPTRFANDVHVLSRHEMLLAPWNAKRFPAADGVAWHFHGLRLLTDGKVLLHKDYEVPPEVERKVYRPYLACLRRQVEKLGHGRPQAPTPSPALEWLRVLVRTCTGRKGALARRPRVVALLGHWDKSR